MYNSIENTFDLTKRITPLTILGAAGVAATTTAGMAAGGAAAGWAIGSFADNSSSRQQAFATRIQNEENKIHIYPDKIYIGLKKLPVNGSQNI